MNTDKNPYAPLAGYLSCWTALLRTKGEKRNEQTNQHEDDLSPYCNHPGDCALLFYKKQARQAKVSEFGKYQGYSKEIYDGNKRISDYLTLSDRTRLAYDLILPTKNGVPADKPLPVLFKYTPYGRAWTIYDKKGKNNLAELVALPWYYEPMLRIRSWLKGNVMDALFRTKWLGEMVNSGYAVVVMDRPGTGASFGKLSPGPEAGAKETNEILNWIAAEEPVELVFDLLPTAHQFAKGKCICQQLRHAGYRSGAKAPFAKG